VAEKTHSAEDALEIPKDIGPLLDRYAAALGKEYLFPVSRQQAFERLARKFLPREGAQHE
jgi:hypothetical protein